MKKINWRHIAVHSSAISLLAFAFQNYAYLTDVKLAELLRHSDSNKIYSEYYPTMLPISNLTLSTGFLHIGGLIVGLTISLLVSVRRKWLRTNSLIAFLIIATLDYFNLLGWSYLKNIYLFTGELTKGGWYYFINGTVMLLLGLLLLLTKKSSTFINGNYAKDKLDAPNMNCVQNQIKMLV